MRDFLIAMALLLSLWGVGVWVGYVAGTNSASAKTEELFLKNSTLSLGEVALCLDVIYRSEK